MAQRYVQSMVVDVKDEAILNDPALRLLPLFHDDDKPEANYE